MKKCKKCPYKNRCNDECYGENPCDFAKSFDKLQKKIDRLTKENESLKADKESLQGRLNAVLNPDF